jgi:haloalkane dehalogenase
VDQLLSQLDLRRITLVGHGWGGAIGLSVVARQPDRFARVVLCNAFLPTGQDVQPDPFHAWREHARATAELPVPDIVESAVLNKLSPRMLAAYAAPFPDPAHEAAVRQFPSLFPAGAHAPGAAECRAVWRALAHLEIPIHTAFSDGDVPLHGVDEMFRQLPAGRRAAHTTIRGAGHFSVEDRGPELAHAVLDFIEGSGESL